MKNALFLLLPALLSPAFAGAQPLLTKEEALALTLENNYDIRITQRDVATAQNDQSVYNTGYLPTFTGQAGARYSARNSLTEFQEGLVNTIDGAGSLSYNASVGFSYTLFDGFRRSQTLNRLKERYSLSELQARQVMENTLLTLFSTYYEVARLTENERIQKATLAISRRRLTGAQYAFEYGQNTRLDVLNAEVDVNNDSVSYLTVKQQWANARRDLNIVLGRAVNEPVEVDTTVSYGVALALSDLLDKARQRNAALQQAAKNVLVGGYDVKIGRAGWLPRVDLTGAYTWNDTRSDAINPFSPVRSSQNGFNAGVDFSWNIFDGGRNHTVAQNARIALQKTELQQQKQEQQLERDVSNAWETYQNALTTLRVQEKSIETNRDNFERTREKYKLGQVTSIVFRQAQLNLVSAQLLMSQAKYNAKNAELRLLQLAGVLLEADF